MPKIVLNLKMSDRYLITDHNAIYFCTFTVVKWIDVFTRKEYKLILVDSLNFCIENKGLRCFSYVIMSNHMHVIWQAKEGNQFSDLLRDFKKFTSKEIVKAIQELPESRREWLLDKFAFEAKTTRRAENFKLWKDDNHAIELDSNYLMEQKLEYIHQNPVKAMLVDNPEDYVFSSARDYAGEKGLVNVELLE
jgi:putative transposase